MPRRLDRGAGYSGKTGLTRVGWLKIGAVQIRSAPTRGKPASAEGAEGFLRALFGFEPPEPVAGVSMH
jgi:hypothetical protein